MKSLIYCIILGCTVLLIPRDADAAGSFQDYRFYSTSLNREMAGRIYLPEGYNPNNEDIRFPVIYFLHGASLGYDQYDLIYPILDNLIKFKQVKPVILVLPDGLAPPYNGSFYTNSVLYGNFEDYISQDLIGFIDSSFHTKPERNKRAIMGASMGAYGALKIAMKHPELFIGVAGHSGPVNTEMLNIFIPDLIAEDGGSAPFNWSPGPGKSLTNLTFSMAGAFSPNLNNLYQVDFPLDSLAQPVPEVMERWKKENVCEIARRFHPADNLSISFDCGLFDEYYLYYQNRSFADTLKKYSVPYSYEEYIGTHTTGLPIRVSISFINFDKLFLSGSATHSIVTGAKEWNLYPNPAAGILNVSQNGNDSFPENCQLVLSDLTGRVALIREIKQNPQTVNISDLPPGIYFYKVQGGNITQTGKTIINR